MFRLIMMLCFFTYATAFYSTTKTSAQMLKFTGNRCRTIYSKSGTGGGGKAAASASKNTGKSDGTGKSEGKGGATPMTPDADT